MKKKFFIITFIFCSIFSLFSKDIYSNADLKSKKILKQIDQLLKEQKFETAFSTIPTDNEFLLAKKVEIACNGFAQSMMHQMFAFKDLDKNETLYDVRTNDGTYSLYGFDPVKEINSFISKNGEKPILNYALAYYYTDVRLRYGNQWLIPEEELYDKAGLYFQKALDENCYDENSLSELATYYYLKQKYEEARKIYELKKKEFDFSATDNFHYGILLWFANEGKSGVEYVKKSIEGYNDNPDYQSDSYIVTARIYLSLGDYKNAESYLKKCQSSFPNDYRSIQYSIALYAAQNMKDKTVAACMELFELAPTNPSVCQMIMEQCNNAGKQEFAIEFFKEAVKKYNSDSYICENLYFHYAYEYYYMGNLEQAKETAKKARSYFEKNGDMTADIDALLNFSYQ